MPVIYPRWRKSNDMMRPVGDEQAREIETARLLLDAARYLGETLDLQRVYERFRELMAEAIPHDGVVVSSFDAEDGIIRCDYAWVDGELLDVSIFPPLRLQASGGMQSQVIRTGEPLLTNDVAARVQDKGTYYDVDREGTMRKVPDEGPPKAQAAMMIPVKHEGAVVGVVQLMSDHSTYAEAQLELAEGMVAQMGAAVRNARLHEERLRLEASAGAAAGGEQERVHRHRLARPADADDRGARRRQHAASNGRRARGRDPAPAARDDLDAGGAARAGDGERAPRRPARPQRGEARARGRRRRVGRARHRRRPGADAARGDDGRAAARPGRRRIRRRGPAAAG